MQQWDWQVIDRRALSQSPSSLQHKAGWAGDTGAVFADLTQGVGGVGIHGCASVIVREGQLAGGLPALEWRPRLHLPVTRTVC